MDDSQITPTSAPGRSSLLRLGRRGERTDTGVGGGG